MSAITLFFIDIACLSGNHACLDKTLKFIGSIVCEPGVSTTALLYNMCESAVEMEVYIEVL